MAKVKITGHASGSGVFTITAPNSNTDRTITLPDASVTLGTDATKLPLSGGTMSGNIVMGDDTSIGISDSAERIEFDGAGDINILGANLGIGTTTPAISGIYSDGTNNIIGGTYLTIRDDDANQCGILELASSQTATAKAVGGISFINHDNASSEYQRKNIASITCRTVTSDNNAGDDCGGDIVFTNKPEAGDVAQRMRITSDGRGLSGFTAKGWVRFNGTTINDSHNVSSVEVSATGQYRVNWNVDFANANYAVAGMGHADRLLSYDGAPNAAYVNLNSYATSGSREGGNYESVIAFGTGT